MDAGHPTGRRVSFVNSFAIEGHYFNFSSPGQWMWDELRLVVPVGADPIRSSTASRSWWSARPRKRKVAEGSGETSSRYRVKTFSAVPGIHVVPTGRIEVVVRYITRAPERHDSRRRLYEAVVELMHGKPGQGADAA